MIAYDFNIFWLAGRALLAGQSPYSITGFYSPLPFAWLMVPFALLPLYPAFVIWTVLNLIAFVALTRKRAMFFLLFLPVIFHLWVGQVDLLILASGLLGGWLGVAFTTLKPQLAFWIIPYVIIRDRKSNERRKLFITGLIIGFIYGLSWLIDPGWVAAWQANTVSLLEYAAHASSLFGAMALMPIPWRISFLIIAFIGLVAGIWMKRKGTDYWLIAAIFNPLANIYSLTMILNSIDLIAIILSWLLIPVSLVLHTGLPWVLVPIYLVIKQKYLLSKL